MLRICIVALMFLYSLFSMSQTLILNGCVTDAGADENLPGVSVVLRKKGNTVIDGFDRTDVDGKYSIKVKVPLRGYELVFSMMGFDTKVVSIDENRLIYNVALAEKATELREVIVNAPAINMKGDTILYNVAKYAGKGDRTIGDVIRNMPGIDVSQNGKISYNGQEIISFYIEGKNMLGGKYGLATNTIHYDDVATVEVMENHQPMKVLQDVFFSQSPAINLRLKEKARSQWAGTVKVGGGLNPGLWQGEFSLMRFAKKEQTLNTYKTNNTGDDVTRDFNDFSFESVRGGFGLNYALRNFISIKPFVLSELDSRRSRFNRTHAVGTNNLFNLSRDYELAVNASYINNVLTADNSTETSYFLNNGDRIVTLESVNERIATNDFKLDLTLRANTKALYVENKLKTNLQWNDVTENITGSFPNFSDARFNNKQVSDYLHMIKRYGKNIFELRSSNIYIEKPQQLVVYRDDGSVSRQDIKSSAFYTDTYTSYGFVSGKFSLSASAGVSGLVRKMETDMSGMPAGLADNKNDVRMNYWRTYIVPELYFKSRRIDAVLKIPLSLTFYKFKNFMSGHDADKELPQYEISAYSEYRVMPGFKFYVNGFYKQLEVDEQMFYDGLVMSDYHNVSLGMVAYDYGSLSMIEGGLVFERPLNAFFSRFSVSHTWYSVPFANSRVFSEEYILNSFLPQNGASRIWRFSGRASKGVSLINGTFSLNVLYEKNNSFLYQNNERTDFSSSSLTISPTIKFVPIKWLDVQYRFDFNKMWLKMMSVNTSSTTNNLSQSLTCRIEPFKKWLFGITCEHYRNETETGIIKNIFLADIEVNWMLKNVELGLRVTNLFDKKDYFYTIYDGVSSVFHSFNIRPRNIIMNVLFQF